jgi:hypothetical protein
MHSKRHFERRTLEGVQAACTGLSSVLNISIAEARYKFLHALGGDLKRADRIKVNELAEENGSPVSLRLPGE